MAFFHGRYGNLSTNEAAIQTLKDIALEIKPEQLTKWNDINASPDERYDSLRLVRQIEGLQRVLWLNKGFPPATGLPVFFDHTKEPTW